MNHLVFLKLFFVLSFTQYSNTEFRTGFIFYNTDQKFLANGYFVFVDIDSNESIKENILKINFKTQKSYYLFLNMLFLNKILDGDSVSTYGYSFENQSSKSKLRDLIFIPVVVKIQKSVYFPLPENPDKTEEDISREIIFEGKKIVSKFEDLQQNYGVITKIESYINLQ